MKTSLRANLLKHLIAKKEEGGFTLIELLVVIIIIGILAAIALPSFLNQANKAKQSEAQTYVGSMNRAQQAYYLENNEFTSVISFLGLGIRESTQNYSYTATTNNATTVRVTNNAEPLDQNGSASPLVAFVGGTYVGTISAASADGSAVDETTTLSVLCRANQPPVRNGPDGTQTFADGLAAATQGQECAELPADGGGYKNVN